MEERMLLGENEAAKNDGSEIVSAFTDLPMGLLICQPFLEVAKGQAALCEVYLETISKLAYDTKKKSEGDKSTRVLSFEYTKPIIDSATGSSKNQTYTINAPLLSLITIPALFMEEASVNFSMDVNVSTIDKSDQSTEASMGVSSSFWGVRAQFDGKVAASSSHTRQTSTTAKYDIFARATQKEPAEGMAKLTSLLASTIEPIEIGK